MVTGSSNIMVAITKNKYQRESAFSTRRVVSHCVKIHSFLNGLPKRRSENQLIRKKHSIQYFTTRTQMCYELNTFFDGEHLRRVTFGMIL